ncbi:MAG: hypothetical protein Q8L10_02350 [Candidatus Moranbacteria bacterium]|nr:hypothetical protein [Candidatus Moranbacteria bacterium]
MVFEKPTIAGKILPSIERAKDFGFKEKIDADGIREIITIGNERRGGCPFSCPGCGVHDEVFLVSDSSNRMYMQEALNILKIKLSQRREQFKANGYHPCIYNQGNTTNKEELSRDNLAFLLRGLSELDPLPEYVSLNSRGAFIDSELLDEINRLGLPFGVHFIIGVESLTDKGSAMYGKKNIAQEIAKLFSVLQDSNRRPGQKQLFGIDAGFVFLPEFYLAEGETRQDKEKVKQGFISDVEVFIDQYVGKGVPARINLHPYYKIPSLPQEDSCEAFTEFMTGVMALIVELRQINKKSSPEEKAALFIGLQDSGYGTDKWKDVFAVWGDVVDRLNALKDYDSEECFEIITEIIQIMEKDLVK